MKNFCSGCEQGINVQSVIEYVFGLKNEELEPALDLNYVSRSLGGAQPIIGIVYSLF